MFEGFVNPGLAIGASLAAVPLVIHLLNRQRYRPMRWAAMRFVLAAYKKTRRRVQLENLLLLLLRMAAVALLAFAVARPFAAGDSPLAGLTESRRDLVLVLDGSASTGYREDVETVFERIVRRAGELVSELDGTKGDRVHVVIAGDHPRLVAWTTPDKALSVLSTLTAPTDERLDLALAFGEVLVLVEEDAAGTSESALEVRLLSDLQRAAFQDVRPADGIDAADAAAGDTDDSDPGDEGNQPLLIEQLDALAQFGVRIIVEDLGPAAETPANLTLEAVAPLQDTYGVHVPIEIAARVANHGTSPRPAQRVALYVDGDRQPVQRIDVPAGGTAEAVFSIQFDEPGAHTLRAELDGDKLAIDDARSSVIEVPPPIRVLVVNGSRSDRFVDDETGFLMAVLEPPTDDALGPAASPFDPREVTPDALLGATASDLDLADFDVIVLANVATLTDSTVTALEERVAAGASLLVTVGDRMGDLAAFNAKLYSADGSGLLPASLGRKVSAARRESFYHIAEFDEQHPALAFFADDTWRPLFTEAPVFDFLTTRGLVAGAKGLATLDDEDRSPLLIERAYAGGRVFLWTTTISRAWTKIPEWPHTLVPFVHELFRYAGRRRTPSRNVAPGQPVAVETASFPRTPQLVRPDGSRRALDGESFETATGAWRLPEIGVGDTEHVGLYEIELEGTASEFFSVQLDPTEGDLDRIAPAELASLHPALTALERGDALKGDVGALPRRGEIWRMLALLTLIALVAESLWAAWIGHKRSLPG